jgi:hypothetical protein
MKTVNQTQYQYQVLRNLFTNDRIDFWVSVCMYIVTIKLLMHFSIVHPPKNVKKESHHQHHRLILYLILYLIPS